MLRPLIFLAQATKDALRDFKNASGASNLNARELLLIASAGLAVALLVIIWASIFRRRRRDHGEPQPKRHKPVHKPAHTSHEGMEAGDRVKVRKRMRRRDHRPRNPTLQETGGLPPPRTEEQPPPF
jgi:hypothetical protein